MTLKEQIEQRYGSFELSHEKNVAITKNIEEFIDDVAIKFAEWCRDGRSAKYKDILRESFDKSQIDVTKELFIYFKENIYEK